MTDPNDAVDDVDNDRALPSKKKSTTAASGGGDRVKLFKSTKSGASLDTTKVHNFQMGNSGTGGGVGGSGPASSNHNGQSTSTNAAGLSLLADGTVSTNNQNSDTDQIIYVGKQMFLYQNRHIDYVKIYYQYAHYVMAYVYGCLEQLDGSIMNNLKHIFCTAFMAILSYNHIPYNSTITVYESDQPVLLGEPAVCELDESTGSLQLYFSRAIVTAYLQKPNSTKNIQYASSLLNSNCANPNNLGLLPRNNGFSNCHSIDLKFGRNSTPSERTKKNQWRDPNQPSDVLSPENYELFSSARNGGGGRIMGNVDRLTNKPNQIEISKVLRQTQNKSPNPVLRIDLTDNVQTAAANTLFRIFCLADHTATHYLNSYASGCTDWIDHCGFTETPFTTGHTLFFINGQLNGGPRGNTKTGSNDVTGVDAMPTLTRLSENEWSSSGQLNNEDHWLSRLQALSQPTPKNTLYV